jgi:eukaryotic-like serine/threonine-protein kinase
MIGPEKHSMSEEQLFHDALDLPAEQREEFVDAACGEDREMSARVKRLLGANASPDSFLNKPVAELADTQGMPALPESSSVGEVIGPYKLLEKIGEGGMGVVYVAEQLEPVRRRVALKLIKPGMDSQQVIARFEAERQALAMMDAPGIASVLDAGATDAGRPYFVMELVRGMPITQYCDETSMSTRDRLQLFVSVCHAVQHAHQKGIIHRDLKPGNVLITQHNGSPVPKVIDFGVAKAVNQRLTEATIYTRFNELIGTPLYMSPEQADLSDSDVDTRSDIYSLGVMLYELLTGTTPFARDLLHDAGFDEMRRIIREDEPATPSTRLGTLDESDCSTISERRGTDPRRLTRDVRGELDWIAMKAMDKDRTRRYESAGTLADDIERYLGGRAVRACPPSAAYRLSKFAARNRTVLSTFAVVTFALVAGTIASLWQAREAVVARGLAEDRSVELEQRSAELLTQRDRADVAANAAREHEAIALRLAYAADIRLAAQAWERGDVRQYTDLLDRYDNPKAGEDLRGFEWWYLCQLGNVESKTIVDSIAGWFCLAHSRDGRFLAAGRRDGTIGLWDASSYEQLVMFDGHVGSVGGIDFSPAGDRLASIGDDGMIRLWSVPDMGEILAFQASKKSVNAVRFALGGSTLVSCADEPDVRLWDAMSGDLLATLSTDGEENGELAVSSDGRFCVGGDRVWKYRLWDLTTREEMQEVPASHAIRCLHFSISGEALAAGLENNSIELRSFEDLGHNVVSMFSGHDDNIEDLAFHPDGTMMASCDRAGVIRTWNLVPSTKRSDTSESGKLPLAFRSHTARVWAVDYSRSGNRLVSASNDGTIRVWSTRTSVTKELGVPQLIAATFTATGNELVFSRDDHLGIWNRRTRRSLPLATGALNLGNLVALSSDNRTVATNHEDGSVRLWNRETGSLIRTLRAHEEHIEGIRFSPNSSLLITAGWDGTCKVWDVATGEVMHVIDVPPHCEDAVFAPDGTTFAISTENVAMIYDAESGRRLHLLQGHENTAECLVYSPDGRWLATGSHDRTIRVWDTTTGQLEHVIPAQQHKIYAIAFSPDGKTIVSGDRHGHIAFSHVSSGRFLFDHYVFAGRIDLLEFSPSGDTLLAVDRHDRAVLLNTHQVLFGH